VTPEADGVGARAGTDEERGEGWRIREKRYILRYVIQSKLHRHQSEKYLKFPNHLKSSVYCTKEYVQEVSPILASKKI
jgi:hypothetical protein